MQFFWGGNVFKKSLVGYRVGVFCSSEALFIMLAPPSDFEAYAQHHTDDVVRSVDQRAAAGWPTRVGKLNSLQLRKR